MTQEVLLDVTRLIWRRWRGGLPTGVDRVCLAYLEHFGPRARAVVQRKGIHIVLSRHRSLRLFRLLSAGGSGFREMGIERTKPVTALREAIELIRRLLAGEEVDYAGELVRFRRGALEFATRRDIPVVVCEPREPTRQGEGLTS